jgi:hypothetical protein
VRKTIERKPHPPLRRTKKNISLRRRVIINLPHLAAATKTMVTMTTKRVEIRIGRDSSLTRTITLSLRVSWHY